MKAITFTRIYEVSDEELKNGTLEEVAREKFANDFLELDASEDNFSIQEPQFTADAVK